MTKHVWLRSGTKCKVLAEYKDKLWLIATDGSWGPGTINKVDTVTIKPVKKCKKCGEAL